jgi:hypothetical protein
MSKANLQMLLFLVIGIALLLAPASCGKAGETKLSGGILATFDVIGERYSIFISNPATIQQVLALKAGTASASIPNGRLVRGQVFYNKPWSWHIDSQDIAMVDFTIEIYDGLPSHVQNDLNYWLDTVGRFAPWQAKLTAVQDYR